MTYKLHKNGVITGSLNSFCLGCEVFLKSQQEATDHILTSEHKKKSNAVQYSDKFKDEHIKKFKGGYYCEFCNVLVPIASKVNLHITETEHKHNKGILLLKPMGGDVVAFNNILIEEKAWHGLIDEICSLCNAEFEDENDHKADAGHSLNLVLKPIQFGHSAIYRHLDDTAVQCLTCNKLLAPGKMTKHFDDTEHHELYAKHRIETNGNCQGIETEENCQDVEAKVNCQEKATNITSVIKKDEEIKKSKIDNGVNKNNNVKSEVKDKSKILESIAKYQTKGMNVNLETETAFCKKCSQVVTFDFMEIENHMENHTSATKVNSDLQYPSNLDQNLNRVDINDKTTQSSDDKQNAEVLNDIKDLPDTDPKDCPSNIDSDSNSDLSASVSDWHDTEKEGFKKCNQEEEARAFAKAHKINHGGEKNQSYCRICEVHLPASLRSMKEHVEGANHKRLASASTKTQTKAPGWLTKQSTAEFLDSAYDVKGFFYTSSLINEKYCIHQVSFYLIVENDSRMRCIVCEVNLPPYSDVTEHCRTRQHLDKWTDVPVIISEKREFIREVRPGLFHCAYCHLAISGWDKMKQHLECSDHWENRSIGESRMRQHMPDLQRFKMKQQMEAITMMRFFNMFN